MRKWQNEEARAEAVVSRHRFMSVAVVSLAVTAIFLGGIKGCSDYHIEKVKHPVKYEENYDRKYERGGEQ